MNTIITKICEDNNLPYINSNAISGGDINSAYTVETNKGKFFLKLNSAAKFPAMFEKEAEGLRALQQALLLKVPKVVATGVVDEQQYLLLEMLEKTSPSAGFWDVFAEGLASFHFTTNRAFGWHSSNYIGSLVQQNNNQSSWGEFYTTQRIMPLVEKLFNNHDLSSADVSNTQKLCARLSEIFPDEPPALLHGDLWAGNFMCVKMNDASNRAMPSIYDPAVYFGHREMDIGMSLLFGGFDKKFYDAYNACYPLEKEWQKRVPLTQLYPLLVHALLFGGSYISSCKSILNSWK